MRQRPVLRSITMIGPALATPLGNDNGSCFLTMCCSICLSLVAEELLPYAGEFAAEESGVVVATELLAIPACFRMHSSLQYTEFVLDGLLQTTQPAIERATTFGGLSEPVVDVPPMLALLVSKNSVIFGCCFSCFFFEQFGQLHSTPSSSICWPIAFVTLTHLPWNHSSHVSQQIMKRLLCGCMQMHHSLSGSSSEFQLSSDSASSSALAVAMAAATAAELCRFPRPDVDDASEVLRLEVPLLLPPPPPLPRDSSIIRLPDPSSYDTDPVLTLVDCFEDFA